MLEVKGTSIISQIEFVKEKFGDTGYRRWVGALSEEARELVEGPLLATRWYGGNHATMELRQKICDVLFNGDPQGARDLGRFTAERGLKGIYRVFVRIGSPEWICSRSAQVFGSYFRPAKLTPLIAKEGRLLARLTEFPEKSAVFEESFVGFTERGLSLSGGKDVKVERTSSIVRGDPYTDFMCTWLAP